MSDVLVLLPFVSFIAGNSKLTKVYFLSLFTADPSRELLCTLGEDKFHGERAASTSCPLFMLKSYNKIFIKLGDYVCGKNYFAKFDNQSNISRYSRGIAIELPKYWLN